MSAINFRPPIEFSASSSKKVKVLIADKFALVRLIVLATKRVQLKILHKAFRCRFLDSQNHSKDASMLLRMIVEKRKLKNAIMKKQDIKHVEACVGARFILITNCPTKSTKVTGKIR